MTISEGASPVIEEVGYSPDEWPKLVQAWSNVTLELGQFDPAPEPVASPAPENIRRPLPPEAYD